jgi:hypothetical protein
MNHVDNHDLLDYDRQMYEYVPNLHRLELNQWFYNKIKIKIIQ